MVILLSIANLAYGTLFLLGYLLRKAELSMAIALLIVVLFCNSYVLLSVLQ